MKINNLNITHGIDIVDLNRKELLSFGLAKRFMTKNEFLKYCEIKDINQKKIYLASLWSLKESIIKATNKKFLFSKIEIYLSNNKAPSCNIENINLSISYEQKYVIGSAIYISK